jgi:hypothetical protein
MNSAVALTPLQLKSSLNILKQSPEALIDLIAQYRKVLDETESEIKLRGVTIEHPLVRRFRHWNPVIVKEGKTLIWNPKKQIHGRPQDILQAARAILKAIGCIQFFREGAITVEAIQSISPMLIEMANGAASAKTILSAHCAHLKHRAGINLKDTVIRLKGVELRLNLQEDIGADLSAIYTLPLLKLFGKHLGSAIDITYIYSNGEEPASSESVNNCIFVL